MVIKKRSETEQNVWINNWGKHAAWFEAVGCRRGLMDAPLTLHVCSYFLRPLLVLLDLLKTRNGHFS